MALWLRWYRLWVNGPRRVAEAVRAVFGSVVLTAARAVFAQVAVGVWRLRSVAVVGAGWLAV